MFRSSATLALLLSLGVMGCGESHAPGGPGPADAGDGDAGSPTPTSDLPCSVAEVLAANCWECHTDPPRNAAPMPLISWDDLHADAFGAPGNQVWEQVGVRVRSTESPMPPPPRPMLDTEALGALDAWFADGAPMRTADDSCDPVMPPPPPDGELPCDEPSYEFLAHADGASDAPFAVPPTANNLYQCFTFRSPFGAGEQGSAWGPVIDDERVLHHWILYRTTTPQEDGGVGPCNMPADATFMMGWAPGGGVFTMPDDVGLELSTGADEWLILQIHYWNVAGHTDVLDRSGVALCTADSPRPQTAGVLTFGSTAINLPARSRDVTVVGECPGMLTTVLSQPLNVLASFPHMHNLGTRIRGEILRGGTTPEMLVEVDPWDFENQISYVHDPPMQIRPGDGVRTTCVYDNPTGSRVRFGERTEDEMCFNFALVYPLDAIPPGAPRICVL